MRRAASLLSVRTKGGAIKYFDAARVDGANFWQTFQLAWPLARPITATVIIFHFLHTWNEFNIPLIFTFSKPELRNLAVGMFAFQSEYSFDWTGFAAGTVISIIPVLIVFLLFQNYFVRGLAGAVKEYPPWFPHKF